MLCAPELSIHDITRVERATMDVPTDDLGRGFSVTRISVWAGDEHALMLTLHSVDGAALPIDESQPAQPSAPTINADMLAALKMIRDVDVPSAVWDIIQAAIGKAEGR